MFTKSAFIFLAGVFFGMSNCVAETEKQLVLFFVSGAIVVVAEADRFSETSTGIVLVSAMAIGAYLGEKYIGDLGTGYSYIGVAVGVAIGIFTAIIVSAIPRMFGFVFSNKIDKGP